MPSHKLNIAAQAKDYQDLAAHVNEALNNVDKDLLETTDIYQGRTAAYWAIQKGSPECLGVMAKAGANLHRSCPHKWEIEDATGFTEGCIVDPSDDEKLKIHDSLNRTTLSYVTRTCCGCLNNQKLKSCSRCMMARYCSEECQLKDWANHQLVCNRIQIGAGLVTVHKKFPDAAKTNPAGFEPFEEEDGIIDTDAENRRNNVCWEYYDLETKTWKAYPVELNKSIEYVFSKGEFTRYLFRPGKPEAEGVEEDPITCVPSTDVATHCICFSHMIDHQMYTGAGRKIRRKVVVDAEPNNAQSKGSCSPLCGALN